MAATKEEMKQMLRELRKPNDEFLTDEKIEELAEKYERELATKTAQTKKDEE